MTDITGEGDPSFSYIIACPLCSNTFGSDEIRAQLQDYVRRLATAAGGRAHGYPTAAPSDALPPAIRESLANFQRQHPDPRKAAFILMSFVKSHAHDAIAAAIREVLRRHDIEGLRADDTEHHEDLFSNVRTYMHGCAFGIAVYERISGETFNPNVALEVGYMFSLGRPVCLLKDKTLSTLPADLVGKLYREFDTQNPQETIPAQLEKWMVDRRLVPNEPTG